jgi:hypothetical protein
MDLSQKIRSLPEPVQDYLYSEGLLHADGQVIERNGLDFEKQKAFLRLLQRAFVREVPMSDLEKESAALLAGDGEKAKALARDIAGYCLLPLDRWLGDVSGYIRRLGGDPSSYPPDRVQLIEKTRDEAAAEIVSSSGGAAEATLRIKERMQDVVTSFLAGIRTEAQALEVLTRSDKIGGVGLDAAAAKSVIDHAKDEARAVVIKEEQAVGASAPAAADTEAGAAAPAPSPAPKPKEDFATIKPEDEEEIERFKEDVLPAKGAEQADETAKRIDASVRQIYLASGLKTDDEAMEKRIKTVIGNRLRDVRDQMETLETMVQPKELGGLGLSQDAARALLNAIQSSLHEVHEEHAAQIQEEKAQWVEGERQKEAEAPAKQAAAKESELESLYQSIIAKSKKATRMAALAPTPPAPPPAAAPKVPAGPPPNLPVSDANPVPPQLRAPVTIPLPAQAPAASSTPTVMPSVPPLTLVRPVPGVPAAPPSVARAPGEPARPRMEDVKAVPKLTGPVEELRAIGIVDFRRLSKDPKEACLKVKDKIDLLAEQSYTRRTEGIAAWSASEVVRTYLEQMREGLNGTPLKDAIAARQAAKKPFLTPEEFQAVAELSRQLRY